MDAPTVVAVLVAGAVALKILADLTVRHLAMERIRLKNEADAAAFEAAAQLMSESSPPAAGAGGTGTRTAP
ncbi:hypothetical protein [Alienimonas californiensis]|uniref:Uncharacterized protein n=1 Tax=Alienimonas californiensis TaxID=2527989 RepID=A0A517P645_9PLAN|nr:hypothetical protein [Alienimonas californiensis]QDT14826.1 hypothetical protein CA12_09060 [Alienimonas californiensis]